VPTFRCVPCLSEKAALRLTWGLIYSSILGNLVAIVTAAVTGGLAWQS